ncbi:MAG: host-nuclease inhibitor Gam family protein [Phycisphaerae bacterium]|jgi:phage host-nuclease inhibitor protein Gam
MAAKRIKSEINIEPIASWDEADEKLRRIGDLMLKIASCESAAKDTIDKAKYDLVQAVMPLQGKIEQLTQSLEAYAANHIDDFGKAQSRELNFGKLGWRKSTAIAIGKRTLEFIKEVFGKRAAQYISVKESVNKETLKLLTDQELASVKARRENKEVFFVEPDLPKAVDYE